MKEERRTCRTSAVYLAVCCTQALSWVFDARFYRASCFTSKATCKIKFVESIYLFACPEQHHLLLLNILSNLVSVIMWFKWKAPSSYTACPRPPLMSPGVGSWSKMGQSEPSLKGLNLRFKTGVSPLLLTKLEDVSLEAVGLSCFMFQPFVKKPIQENEAKMQRE